MKTINIDNEPRIEIWEDKNKKKHKIHVLTNRYVCVSDMAKATKKQLAKYLNSQETQEYLQEVSLDVVLPIDNKTSLVPNGTPETRMTMPSIIVFNYAGSNKTYVHPLVATHFAHWANARFALWVHKLLDNLLQGKASKTLPIGIDPSRHRIYLPLEDGKADWQKAFFKPLYDAFYCYAKLDHS